MLRDTEVESGGAAPRIHSMDEYFMIEVEKVTFLCHFCLVFTIFPVDLCNFFFSIFPIMPSTSISCFEEFNASDI